MLSKLWKESAVISLDRIYGLRLSLPFLLEVRENKKA